MTGYFPRATWHSIWDHSVVNASEGGITQQLEAPLGTIPVHVRGGSIVPMQDFGLTTAAVRGTPLSLLAALPADLVGPLHCRTAVAHGLRVRGCALSTGFAGVCCWAWRTVQGFHLAVGCHASLA